jgi:hypothetical protein
MFRKVSGTGEESHVRNAGFVGVEPDPTRGFFEAENGTKGQVHVLG